MVKFYLMLKNCIHDEWPLYIIFLNNILGNDSSFDVSPYRLTEVPPNQLKREKAALVLCLII